MKETQAHCHQNHYPNTRQNWYINKKIIAGRIWRCDIEKLGNPTAIIISNSLFIHLIESESERLFPSKICVYGIILLSVCKFSYSILFRQIKPTWFAHVVDGAHKLNTNILWQISTWIVARNFWDCLPGRTF